MKIGTRIMKTGIAVIITMYLCEILKLEPAIFGAVSAVINMQPSIYLTLKTAKEQIVIHILRVGFGVVFGYLLGGNPLVMGAVTVCIIVLYTRLKLQSGILMGIVAAIFVLSSPANNFLEHALLRSAVIFIGLIVSSLINIIILPPRYGHMFVQKLHEYNEKSAEYFSRAVRDFVRIDDEEIPFPSEKRAELLRLNKECLVLAEYYRSERKSTGDGYDLMNLNDWFIVAERFLNYSVSLVEKANQIYEILPVRLERRIKAGMPPISGEYHNLLNLLNSGAVTIERVNTKLRGLICDKISAEQEEISEELWEKYKDAIEEWQPRLTGSYYIHGLIDISVVAMEISVVGKGRQKAVASKST
ncbi:Fusaric acid resistance protein family protein [Pelotomaculum sp. FP]|uniref:FUSC family protein n=1 Tax=Pelotomaculum sp. FP TaxID=261474 RepID=UPI001100BE07|nr:aromatic acid exporter family protein [Pelotomaculum sp. FP]TEB14639.1 Fusaric acid resistance protein family protein [Pelotomaculum sp. FP]